jgi:hypothetical protein
MNRNVFIIALALFMSCGDNPFKPMQEDMTGQHATKPAIDWTRAVVKVTVYDVSAAFNNPDMGIEISRAISGVPRQWKWSGRFNPDRTPVVLTITDDGNIVNGLFEARVVIFDAKGVVQPILQEGWAWASIPINGGRETTLELPIGRQAVIVSEKLLPPPSPMPVISLSVGSLAMDNTNVGSTSQKIFTITNTGNANLSVTGITVIGTDALQFKVSPTAATVAAGGSQSITVTFTPTSAGSKSASLSIAHNTAGSPSSVVLSGMGVMVPPIPSVVFITWSDDPTFSSTPIAVVRGPYVSGGRIEVFIILRSGTSFGEKDRLSTMKLVFEKDNKQVVFNFVNIDIDDLRREMAYFTTPWVDDAVHRAVSIFGGKWTLYRF